MKTIIWNHLDEERGAFYVAIFTDGKNAVCPWRDLPSRNYQQACNKQPLQKINKRNGKHGVNQKQKSKSAEAENGKSVSCEPRNQESGFVHRKTTVWISVFAPVLDHWDNLSLQAMILCFLTGGGAAFGAYWYRCDSYYIVLYGAMGVLFGLILVLVDNGANVGLKRQQLADCLVDYVENSPHFYKNEHAI